MVLETAENVNNRNPSPLEALLAGAEGFPPMLDIPPDADDETMVELAIALSLQQDQQGVHGKPASSFLFHQSSFITLQWHANVLITLIAPLMLHKSKMVDVFKQKNDPY